MGRTVASVCTGARPEVAKASQKPRSARRVSTSGSTACFVCAVIAPTRTGPTPIAGP
jgi:hypothetical protein